MIIRRYRIRGLGGDDEMSGSTGKRILIATLGSLGDLHPYIAIAKELKRRGHRPVIATIDRYRGIVEAEGVDFAIMGPLESQLGDAAEVVRKVLHARNGPEYLIRQIVMRYVRESYEDLDRLANDADLLVSHPMTVALPLVAEMRKRPWVSTVLSPMSLFSAHDPSILPGARFVRYLRFFGPAPYRAILRTAEIWTRSWERPLLNLRAEIGLPPTSKNSLFDGQFSPYLNLALFSSRFARPQPDWPAKTVACGFARYDGSWPDSSAVGRLKSFLGGGDPPFVFTLGSSASMDPGDYFSKAREAAMRLGRRAALIVGDSYAGDSDEASGAIHFPYLPFSEIFPHASVIIHSGGIGTMSQALSAARPMLVTPVAFDQPDNAYRAAKLGVARVLPFRRVTVKGLIDQLSAILGRKEYESTASELGRRVRSEEGASLACDQLEKF